MLSLKIYSQILIFMIIMQINSIKNESPFTQVKSISIATKKMKDFNASGFHYPFLFHAAINEENKYIFHFIFYKTIENIFERDETYTENYKEEDVAKTLKVIADNVLSNSLIYKKKVKNRFRREIKRYLGNWAIEIKAFMENQNQLNTLTVKNGTNCDSQKDNRISFNNETLCFHNIFFACAPPDMIDFFTQNLDPDYNRIKKNCKDVLEYSSEKTGELDFDNIMNTLISVFEKSLKNENVYEVCLYLKTDIHCMLSFIGKNDNENSPSTSDKYLKENELKKKSLIGKKECFLRIRIHPNQGASWNVSSPDFIFNEKVNRGEIHNIKLDDLGLNINSENNGDRCFMNFLEQISKFIMNQSHKKRETPALYEDDSKKNENNNEVKKILWFKYADKFSEEKIEFEPVYIKKKYFCIS